MNCSGCFDDAYDSLENEKGTAELGKAYINNLAKVLGDENVPITSATGAKNVSTEPNKFMANKATKASAAGIVNISAELKARTKRQMYMKKLVEKGQSKIPKASKISERVGAVAEASSFGHANHRSHHPQHTACRACRTSVGWCVCWAAGGLSSIYSLGCVLADINQILSNPAKATRANIAGIAHIMSRMDWYCALTGHLLDNENAGESLNLVLQQLEQKVFTLHKAILLYQIESVCSYYSHQGLVFVGNLANLGNFLWVSLVFNELRHMRGFLRGSKHQGLSSGVAKFV
jgi:hypothetical protein